MMRRLDAIPEDDDLHSLRLAQEEFSSQVARVTVLPEKFFFESNPQRSTPFLELLSRHENSEKGKGYDHHRDDKKI